MMWKGQLLLLLLLLSAADAQWDPYDRLSTAGPIPTPKEDTIAYYPPLSGNLRLGIAAMLTRRDGCGAARVVAATRAIYDVNTRNSTFCPAIANLGSADLFNVSTDVMDHGGSSERAILAGFYFNNMVEKYGFGLYGEPVHGIVGFTTSGASAAGATAMQSLGLPMVCYSATSPLLSLRNGPALKYPNFFRVCPGDQNRVRAAARAMRHMGYTRVVSFYFSEDYTRSMCSSFASTATSLNMTVVSKEVPTTDGTSGSPPDENAIQRIQEALTEIHEDPSMPRVIMLCAFQSELPEVLRQAESMGLRKKEHNYVWFHPDDGNIGDPREALGTFSVSWMPDSDRTPLFEEAWDSGEIRAGGFEYKLGENICGSSQNESCWDMPKGSTWGENDGDVFRYVENTSVTAQNNFAKCKTYTQFGYDSIVMFSAAMHKGITNGKFTRETVTSSLLEETLQEMVGDTSYGECLAGGLLTFNEDQERNLPYMVSNFYLDSADNTVKKANVMLVPDQMSDALVYQATSDLAACSVDYPGEKCFKPNGEGPLDGGFPLGRAETCLDGTYWQRGECVPADLGYYVPEMALDQSMPYMAQTACPVGSYTNVSGQTACTLSSPGYFVNENSTNEVQCAEGTFADEKGAAVCTKCVAGDFQEKRGQTSCDRCEVGRYQDEKGESSCISCPDGRTTLYTGSSSASECICQVDTEYLDDTTDTCKPCPIGINCPAGASLALEIGTDVSNGGYTSLSVKPGYYIPASAVSVGDSAGREDAIINEVYACDALGEAVLSQSGYNTPCPGGPAGSCALNRDAGSLACGRCMDDHFRGSDGTCQKCGGGEAVGLVIMIVLGLTLPVGSYFFINQGVTAKLGELSAAILSFGTFVTSVQLAMVITKISVSWPAGNRDIFRMFAIFAFDLDSVRAECLFGSGATTGYVLTLLIPIMLGAVLFGASFLSRLVFAVSHRLHMKGPETWNTYFTVYQAVFIAIFITVVRPFRCYSHPNGKYSMVDYPDIICWDSDSDHTVMIAFAIIAIFGEVVAFLAYYAWCIMTLPQTSLTDPNVLRSLKFVVYRFRDGAWYWGIIFLIRNTFTGISVIIDPSRPYAQMMVMASVLTGYFLLSVLILPWRGNALNLSDAITCASLVMLVAAAGPAVGEMSAAVETQVSTGTMFFWLFGLGSNVLIFTYLFYVFLRDQFGSKDMQQAKQESDLKKARDMGKRLLRMCQGLCNRSEEEIGKQLVDLGDFDLMRLKRGVRFIEVELLQDDDEIVNTMSWGSIFEARIKTSTQRPSTQKGLHPSEPDSVHLGELANDDPNGEPCGEAAPEVAGAGATDPAAGSTAQEVAGAGATDPAAGSTSETPGVAV